MCNKARRNIWQANPSAVFEIDGCILKKLTDNKSITNNDILTQGSSACSIQNNDIYQESINITKVFFENSPSKSLDYITKSNNILEKILVQNIDETSEKAPF